MEITCYNSQSDLIISTSQVKALVTTILALKKVSCDEVICHFVDKATISSLHRDFFADPTPTDCISFPIDSPSESSQGHFILGEVFVCPRVAIDYAETHHLNPYKELSLYILHGLLHLIGYNDTTLSEKKEMRREEKACLCYLEETKALLTP